MLNLDPAKLLVIFVIALVVLGPERLPNLARQMATAWKEITRVRDQVGEEVRKALPDVGITNIPRIPSARGAISSLFNDPEAPTASTSRPSRPAAALDGDGADSMTPLVDSEPSIAPDDPAMN